MAQEVETIMEEARKLQRQIEELVDAGYGLTHPKILEVSHELDKLIAILLKEQNG